MKKCTKAGTTPQEIPRGSLHMRHKPAPKILQVNALEVPKESVSVITITEEVLASLIDWHCCSVAKSCLTLCDPMDCSKPGFPILHHLPELAQTHVHWVDDAVQISHTLSPFSSCPQSFPASGSFPTSQLFASGGPTIGVSASVFYWHC